MINRTYLPEPPLRTCRPRIEWRETDVGNWIGRITMTTEPEQFWIGKPRAEDQIPDAAAPYRLCIMAADWLAANTEIRRRIHTLGWFASFDAAKGAALAHIERVDAGGRP